MAKRQRDYKAEYQRRVALERERAAREGRPFSRSRARGHRNDSIPDLIRESSPYNIDAMTDIVDSLINDNGVPRQEVIQMLRDKKQAYLAKRRGDPSIGRNRYDHRIEWMPREMWFYNGQ